MRDFPEGFTFGTSAAAHQVEGGNVNNDWWAWEHAPRTTCVEPSGDAIDFWHRYADDAALLGSLGLPAHRMSLEWSRIEPAPGEWSTAALDHYRRILEALHANGISPYVTLHHFTIPRWLSEAGGWLAPDAVARFGVYAERVAAHLGDLIPHVCTINEPQIVSLFGYRLGYHAPGPAPRRPRPPRHAAADRSARDRGRGGEDRAPAPPRPGSASSCPTSSRPDDDAACVAAYEELRHEMETVFLDGLKGDWVGVQYYSRMRVDPAYADGFAPAPEGVPLTAMGWELNPEGLHRAIAAAAATGLPVHVTENGIATEDDAERVAYLETHLAQVARAIADGIDVRAYLYWSAWDNFEWAEGYRPRFGLIGIDRDADLRRTVRPSARALAAVAKTGNVDALHSANPG